MQLVTADLRRRLLANGTRRDADHVPVLKLFDPCGAATRLIAERRPDDPDTLFGLCDLRRGRQERRTHRRVRPRAGGRRRSEPNEGDPAMKRYTVQCGYAGCFANTVVVVAETLEAALEKAVETANADADGWRSLDHCGPTFVQAAAEGIDANPWDGAASALPIPDRFVEGGEPPVVTLTSHPSVGVVEVTRGRVRLRFVEREGTVVADVSDPPPPPTGKPLVIVRRRPDGASHVTVAEGRARVRVLDEIVPD